MIEPEAETEEPEVAMKDVASFDDGVTGLIKRASGFSAVSLDVDGGDEPLIEAPCPHLLAHELDHVLCRGDSWGDGGT